MKLERSKHSHIILNIAGIMIVGIIIYLISSYFDLFEKLYTVIHSLEKYNLDEIILAAIAIAIYSLIWAVVSSKNLQKNNDETIKLNNKLIQEIKIKNLFHQILTHDLRTPFNALIGFTDMLVDSDNTLNDKERKKITKIVNDTSINTFHLLEDILTWTNSQNHNISPSPVKIDLLSVVNSVLSSLESNLKRKELNIILHVPESTFIYADINMVKLILRNLMSNAIKYSYSNNDIHISASLDGSLTFVSIRDSGTGIPLEQKEHVLTKVLKSVPGTLKESGAGIGLMLSKEFIEMNKGHLFIKNNEDTGATSGFTIPTFN